MIGKIEVRKSEAETSKVMCAKSHFTLCTKRIIVVRKGKVQRSEVMCAKIYCISIQKVWLSGKYFTETNRDRYINILI